MTQDAKLTMSENNDLFAGPPPDARAAPRDAAGDRDLEGVIVRSLAERYRGIVDTRGLWLWAGGRENELDYDDDATARWQRLWDSAAGDAAATRIAVVREMLLDLPGDESLLAYLEGRVHDAKPPGAVLGGIFGDLIEAAGADVAPGLLRAVLEALPSPGDSDRTFASLAPALNRRFDADTRAHLERLLDELLYPEDEDQDEPGDAPAGETAGEQGNSGQKAREQEYRDEGSQKPADSEPGKPNGHGAGDAPEPSCSADDLERAVSISIDAFIARFEASPLAHDDDRRQRVLSLTEDLRSAVHQSRSGDAGKPQLKMADALGRLEMEAGAEALDLHVLIAAIGHQVHCLVFVETRHPLPEPIEAARVFARALWATVPKDGSGTATAAS